MSVDDLINKALKGSGGMLDASDMYAVVGNCQANELFVLNLQDYFVDNMFCFGKAESTNAILVGVYATEELARSCIKSIRENQLQAPGLVAAPGWHILMANPQKNELFSLLLTDYYIGCLTFYLYKAPYDNLPIGIFENKETAEDAIDIIRYTIREEKS